MWFWAGWRERLISLRDGLLAPWDVIWAGIKQRPLLAACVLSAAIVVSVGTYRNRADLRDFLENAQDGKIIVNSPTVYTRQRLVNDRLAQARWLRTQLELTEPDKDTDFKLIDRIRNVGASTQLAIATENKPKDPPVLDQVNVEATTMAVFRAKNAYREEVRSEITQTELDDRHDIDGNTIYRLTFDGSVIAGTRKDSIAAIGVRLTHDPKPGNSIFDIYDADYRTLYQDWVEYFQRTLHKSLVSIPRSLLVPEPYPRLRLLFADFLLRRVCQFIKGDPDLNKDPPACGTSELRREAENILKDFTQARANGLQASRSGIFRKRVAAFKAPDYIVQISDPDFLEQLAISACRQNPIRDSIPISNLFIIGQGNRPTRDEIGCPFDDNLKERRLAGVLLYETLLSFAAKKASAPAGPDAPQDTLLAAVKDCSQGACDVPLTALNCFTADFIKSNLNAFQNPGARDQQKVRHFITMEIVGRDVNDCRLLVTGLIDRYPTAPKNQHSEALLAEFIGYLNAGTDAFAYSVTPKNLTENISTAAETRDAIALSLNSKDQTKDVASLLRQRSERNRAIVAHPIVVGFGSGSGVTKTDLGAQGGVSQTTRIHELDFGWIIAPRSYSENVYEQIDGQYPLTVHISVPAWWRTVELNIKTCWLSRTVLPELKLEQTASKICTSDPNYNLKKIIVRLPPAIAEISRKLAFDVVQQPSLYDASPRELVIGMPGSLLLEGARLWRSTEVTVGAQNADKISVLPNMEGIIAEFKCVRPPTGSRRLRENLEVGFDRLETVTYDYVRVWTSEGVTEAAPLTFVWPRQTSDHLEASSLCDDRTRTAQTSTPAQPPRPPPPPPPNNTSQSRNLNPARAEP